MRGLRRHPVVWSVVVAISAIAISGVAISPSFSASFLTKKAAKKLFYTKKKSNARYYTKAQADGRFEPAGDSGGQTRINATGGSWEKSNPVSQVVVGSRNPTGTVFNSGPEALDEFFQLGADLPVVLDGEPLSLVGVNACYQTTTPDTLTLDEVRVFIQDTATNSTEQVITDPTDRTDNACRDYLAASPIPLDPTETVYISYLVDFPGGGGNTFIAERVSFIYSP